MDWKRDRIGSAERGQNPTVLLRMPSGFAVMGDTQFLPGYCLQLGVPRVDDLNSLPMKARIAFLRDMSLVGEAVERACRPQRLDYEIFGDSDPFLHAHVLPRYAWKPTEYLRTPVSLYPRHMRLDPQHQFNSAKHHNLMEQIRASLRELLGDAAVQIS